jgi:hypothetical protein
MANNYDEDWKVPHVRLPPARRARVEHCSIPIRAMIEPGDRATYFADTPDFLFTPRYLIVTTSGFFIEELKLGNQSILWRTDGDLFYRSNWDRLERMGELERVQLMRRKLSPANKFCFWIRQHVGTKKREFRGAFIGEAELSDWV